METRSYSNGEICFSCEWESHSEYPMNIFIHDTCARKERLTIGILALIILFKITWGVLL